MPIPCKLLATAVLAASAAAFAAPVSAAPIAAPSSLLGATAPMAEFVQWWGWGPYDDAGYAYRPGYAYAPGYGWNPGGYAPAPGYSVGYQAGAAAAANCMSRYRSYDPASGTYLGRDRRRHPCP